MAQLTVIELLIGFLFGILAGGLFAGGIVFQKKGVLEMPEIKLTDIKSMTAMLKNKTWALGIILALAGAPLYLLSQAYIGVALSQPITLGLQLAFTVILAMKILDEKIGKIEAIGFSILIASPVLLALGAVTAPDVVLWSEEFYTLLVLYFLLPITITCVIFFILIPKVSENTSGLLYAIITGMLFAIGAIMAQIAVEVIKIGLDLQYLLIGLIFFSILIVANIGATVIQQLAFQKSKTGICIGLQSTFSMLLAIYGGILVFHQLILAPAFFITGLSMIFIGNVLLIQFQTRLEGIEGKTSVNIEPKT